MEVEVEEAAFLMLIHSARSLPELARYLKIRQVITIRIVIY